jgi:hypothetical protein
VTTPMLNFDENGYAYSLMPTYLPAIVQNLKKRGWIIHSFPADDEELYNPTSYLSNQHSDQIDYRCILDANIFQFTVNAVKKSAANANQRDAIALVVFCQLANIELDPTLACYERANYSPALVEEAVNEYALFRMINSGDTDDLAEFALGYTNTLRANRSIVTENAFVAQKIMEFERRKDWDSLYLLTLKITEIRISGNSSSHVKIVSFVSWCLAEFRMSLVALVFSLVAFGKKPAKRMIKFAANQANGEKRKAIFNMTWDLYNATRFFSLWIDKGTSECVFASDDIAFSTVLRAAIWVQNNDASFENLAQHVSEETIGYLNEIPEKMKDWKTRKYLSQDWSPSHRETLIKQLEKSLCIN